MKVTRLNPYYLRITDPLWELANRRELLMALYEENRVPPIWVMNFEQEEYLVYNGNKRTVVARELGRAVPANIIKDDASLWEAQRIDPRQLPPAFPFTYASVYGHLCERADKFSALNQRCLPIPLSSGKRLRL